MFCRHHFEIIDKTVTESAFEQLTNVGLYPEKVSSEDFQKTVIFVFKCSKCGKTKTVKK